MARDKLIFCHRLFGKVCSAVRAPKGMLGSACMEPAIADGGGDFEGDGECSERAIIHGTRAAVLSPLYISISISISLSQSIFLFLFRVPWERHRLG